MLLFQKSSVRKSEEKIVRAKQPMKTLATVKKNRNKFFEAHTHRKERKIKRLFTKKPLPGKRQVIPDQTHQLVAFQNDELILGPFSVY